MSEIGGFVSRTSLHRVRRANVTRCHTQNSSCSLASVENISSLIYGERPAGASLARLTAAKITDLHAAHSGAGSRDMRS